MFNLEVVHSKKNLNLCNLDLHTGEKKKWNLCKEIFTKDNR